MTTERDLDVNVAAGSLSFAVLASPRQPGSLLIAALSLGQMVTVVQQLTVTDTALVGCSYVS